MGDWKEELAIASRERTLSRAQRVRGKGVRYKLGKGGFDPSKALSAECDCSGFVAWAIGIPRELPPGSARWLQTDSYWQGGGRAGEGLFDRVEEGASEPGDVIVYPDREGKQGHMGIVSAVSTGRVIRVIHCSSGNDRSFGDAIQETGPEVFRRVAKTRIVRVDYPALRALFRLPEPQDTAEESVDVPHLDGKLDHPLLAGDPTLRLVVRGTLVLQETGQPVIGCKALQDALNRLGEGEPRYRVDLGTSNRFYGYYGPKTVKAVKSFQVDRGLPATGELDAETLLHLDEALTALAASGPSGSAGPAARVSVSSEGSDWYASLDQGSRFFVGRRVPYGNRSGLTNYYRRSGPVYRPQDFEAELGHWAWMLYPTAIAESEGYFNCINTYDSARFTFGFFQMAAHTANSNLVVLLRRLLGLERAGYYFPDLGVAQDRVVRRTEGGTQPLETAESTAALMSYFNPSDRAVEEIEVVQAAKLIHWAENDPAHRKAQVDVTAEKLKKGMREYAARYALDGVVDSVCLVVADIRHQGRARSSEIIEALGGRGDEGGALSRLLEIGAHRYPDRIATLKRVIRKLTGDGILGRHRYSAQRGEFVPGAG
jgi:peptidoglycan hydrolase-like protein with peptidoglycan-binding domain